MRINRTSRIETLLSIRSMPVEKVIVVLRCKGLLKNSLDCPICGSRTQERSRGDHIDEVGWVCYNSACPKKKSTFSIRLGSFFEGFRLSLADVWTLVLMWSESVSVCDAAQRYGIGRITVAAVYQKLREYTTAYLTANPIRLGGPGIICQIDESLFCHKQKYGRGREAETETWVFGISDTSFTPAKFYMEVVPDRSAETLLPIIRRVCRPGTIIHSDKWAAYRQITSRLDFEHRTVNHTVNFVAPDTGAHTQHIESRWAQEKAKIKAMKGVLSSRLPAMLGEFMWKDSVRGKLMLYLILMIRAE